MTRRTRCTRSPRSRGLLRGGWLAVALLGALCASPARAEPGTFAKLTDAVLVRPLLLIPTFAGAALAVGLYPYDVVAGLDGRTTYYLLEVPYTYAAVRPLGSFSYPQMRPLPKPGQPS